jgi:hypothetical protein
MSFAGIHTLVLQRDGACLREGVARRPWMAGGMGTDGSHLTGHGRKSFDGHDRLEESTNKRPEQATGLGRKLRRSIKGSDTPQCR